METELETARDLASLAVAKEASLEEEKATLKHHLEYFRRVSKTQLEDIKKMKTGNPNPEGDRKLKEAEAKIKTNAKNTRCSGEVKERVNKESGRRSEC